MRYLSLRVIMLPSAAELVARFLRASGYTEVTSPLSGKGDYY